MKSNCSIEEKIHNYQSNIDEYIDNKLFNLEDWSTYIADNNIKIFKQNLHKKSDLIMIFDMSKNKKAEDLIEDLKNEYNYFLDYNSNLKIFIKNISSLKYLPSKNIIDKRIKNRLK